MTTYKDIGVEWHGHVAVVEIQRPPLNFFDNALIQQIADCFEALEQDDRCRAIVLAAQGKAFCAGADFSSSGKALFDPDSPESAIRLYQNAIRLFDCKKPIVGAIHGAAVGGGLGLALVPDFRVVAPEARFAANFVRLGIHPGFGISSVLPRIIGAQKANLMLLTGRRINGEQAYEWGLADQLSSANSVRDDAIALATEIAECAPLAVESTRATARVGLIDELRERVKHEFSEQVWLAKTKDHQEGARAVSERRLGEFKRA
ncbi:enoyl-CoA hydratase/isomerase family protein [Marinobacter litoralis]|uniref:enoyl-CoA hydratase/isomerase family protein n=1 Tax=Marinobacter litoralis TaxID=187981 RepID=UPI0018EC6AC1|nr:enoyl-CoA hydratase/isomerase family protein [Marinobacter litoralis]MBJ6136067.1 enoyl-CoA hydratase/isomerase family protein [Marinobacter litoralis]